MKTNTPKPAKASITFNGIVKDSNGREKAGIDVVLYEQKLRNSVKLESVVTGKKGAYSFSIKKPVVNTAYRVEAKVKKGDISSSDIIFIPKGSINVNVDDLFIKEQLNKGSDSFNLRKPILTEYFEQLKSDVEKRPLSIEDISFVAKQTKQEPRDTFHWLRAHELEIESKIPAEVFYGLFRQGLPTNLKALSLKSGNEIKKALKAAAAANFISEATGKTADAIVLQWNEYVTDKALNDVPQMLDASFSQVLEVAIKDKGKQQKLLTDYLAHEGTSKDFWANTVPVDEKNAIQTVLKLAVLSGNQPDVIEELFNTYRPDQPEHIFHKLAANTETDWVRILKKLETKNKKPAVPSFIKGNEKNSSITQYAAQLEKILEQSYPTHSFFGKLAKDTSKRWPDKSKQVLGLFFNENPQFDINKTSTFSILNDSQFKSDNFNDDEKKLLTTELQSIQRLATYTTNFSAMSRLRADDIDSAFGIVSLPRQTFVGNYQAVLGTSEVTRIYQQAEQNYMRSTMAWVRANSNLSVGTATTPAPIADPTLRTLFGSQDACECEHCTSLYSPAAYYTDILNFLYNRTRPVYDELIRRRPDLIQLDLNCKNTNTPVPYVDLVNELLENQVTSIRNTTFYQTTWQANELAANPEHLNNAAYDVLKQAVYPRVLPFNLPVEEARVYLKHLGVQKHQLMATFFAGTKEEAFEDFDINMERLAISPEEAKILSGETTGDGSGTSGLWNFYGFDKETGYKPLTDPADSSQQISGGNWKDNVTDRVDVFLQQIGITYKDLLTLLQCHSINPLRPGETIRDIEIEAVDDGKSSCQLDNLRLVGADSDRLQKIHRFLRLWNKLGWSMVDVDKACLAFQLAFTDNIAANQAKLNEVSQTNFLSKHLNLPIETLLTFWSNIRTESYPNYFADNSPPIASLYEKLFLNKAVINPVDVAFVNYAALTGALDMDDHTATLLAAFQISDDDYTELKTELGNKDLTLANLSFLYRNALLARKLKLSIKDFLSLKKLVGFDPFASPADTFSFLLKADTVKSSGFSIDELNYIFRHDFKKETGVAPADDDISVFLSALRSSLRQITTSSDDNLRMTEQRKIVVQKFSERLKITTKASDLLLETVRGITDRADAVVKDFSVDIFLRKYVDAADPNKEYEPTFVRTNPAAEATWVPLPDLFNDFIRLEKIAKVITKLKLSDHELAVILRNSASLECTNLAQLPVTTDRGNFTEFDVLINLIKARDSMPLGTPDFIDIVLLAITNPDKTAWLDALLLRTNWDRPTIEALVGNGGTDANAGILSKSFPADFVNGNVILQVKECLAILNRIGLSTSLSQQAIASGFDRSVPDAIKNAARAKYDEVQWLKLAKPLRDELREKQREALVAYILTKADFNPAGGKFERWKNSDELYEYLLIDVEMKPISMTSRLKQAICSVQLFIDRVLLNLEHPNSNPAVGALKLEGAQVEEWKEWRKIYRVWEANRKIFLYPENWLEPELRDDKSPFFSALETQLKQNELTDENVEDAFHTYLGKLDEVAQLEVVGLYHQVETGIADEANIDIQHVFARTYANPHKYFHRTLEKGEWTAWKRLEIDIDGNHIVPAIFNRKLCLFWLFFTQETEEKSDINPSATVSTPPSWWKIQIAWSEYRKNKWTAKRLSKSYITSQNATGKTALENLKAGCVISTYIADDQLYLNISGSVVASKGAFVFNNTNTDPSTDDARFAYGDVLTHTNIISVSANEQMILANNSTQPFEIHIEHDDRDGGMVESIEILTILRKINENKFKLAVPANERAGIYSSFFFQNVKDTFYVVHSKTRNSSMTNPDFGFEDWNDGILANWGEIINPILVDPGDDLRGPITGTRLDDYYRNDSTRTHYLEAEPALGGEIEVRASRSQPRSTRSGVAVAIDLTNSIAANRSGYDDVRLLGIGRGNSTQTRARDQFTFSTFNHEHVKSFIKQLYKQGTKGLLTRSQMELGDKVLFEDKYDPTNLVTPTYPTSKVDFAYGSAYAQYNWELFFHVPMLIACRLKDDQQFEAARDWFHYIFNPTNSEGGGKERFWQFKPFFEEAKTPIETLDDLLKNEAELAPQVEKWMADPFKPHVIARMRINTYMKNVVMKYLDNLIAWGDNLFRRDTIESINEATNLYVLAAKILGERPTQIPPRATRRDERFETIKDQLNSLSNPVVLIETILVTTGSVTAGTSIGSSNAVGLMYYFCTPSNEFLLKYWDTVADRLFKLRHSMNIEGVVRTLPLFEPPIDPAMLVRAAAAGIDLSSILSDMNAPLPHYRFSFMVQKANEFTNEVKALGSALLQALEKRDAETFALLRSTHEQKLLNAALSLKEKQVEDAKAQVESIQKSKEAAQLKFNYYSSRAFTNNFEKTQLASIAAGMVFSIIQGELSTIGGVLAAIPNLKAGAPTSLGVTWGGDNLGAMMNAVSTYMGIYAAINNATGSMAGILGGYTRRMDDWKFQANSTSKELEQLEKQILSSEIKLAIAEKDLQNQQLQIENNQEADEFMRNKFTNEQLYDWMIGQLSTIYFQSYQLAYELAKKAEQCYQYELGKYDDTSFVQFGYWDSLKKGLLSAENLQYDLRRMETSFYDTNKRELELTKHISLFLLNPQAILELRQKGRCEFITPEAIFDLDFQGHYFRRIKSVSISIPCIAGPYTTISATLRLKAHVIRIKETGSTYESNDYKNDVDRRFWHIISPTQSMTTSNAQNDSGLFELNFRDERYLPFEGCGVFGKWELELTTEKELRMFDYNTISDIIMTMRYTAREGVDKALVSTYLKNLITAPITPSDTNSGIELSRMFSLRHEFSGEWHKLFYPPNGGAHEMNFEIIKAHFPYFAQAQNVKLKHVQACGFFTNEETYSIVLSSTVNVNLALTSDNKYMDSKPAPDAFALGSFTFSIKKGGTDAVETDIKDIILVFEYQLVV